MSIADTTAAPTPDPAGDAADDGAAAEAAILRVLRGNPNPVEVAALVVALAHIRARNAAEADPAGPGGTAQAPTSASWDRPQPVAYRSPSSWMRVA